MIYFYIDIENINSSKKILKYDFICIEGEKNQQIFLICYFSLTFGWFFIRPESDPDPFH